MSYYNRVGKTRTYSRHGSCRGFKLNQRRFSVQGLRAKFVYLFRILSRWRYSCAQALKSAKKGTTKRSTSSHIFPRNNSNSRRSLVMVDSSSSSSSSLKNNCRLRSFARSNSFYSEAIADCLEFIKRSSISIDDHQKPVNPY
ncbi:hypothetical protein Ddye_010727 [Dipteronia dyeriana]|uniref:Josephin-like protein n=1 Tax=Dipteronia dyeriana TaxID=168575 RepID=A0AAD9XDR7_9ROSI|nr:hypothetical protein Ddye_010727 [Dipteronia dyeriana]